MRRHVPLMVALAMIPAGCARTDVPPVARLASRPPKPKVGDKVIMPAATFADLWDDVGAMRESLADVGGHEPAYWESPAIKSRAAHLVGGVDPGDLVEVLEVGEDFAGIDIIRDHFGRPKALHGYTKRWW